MLSTRLRTALIKTVDATAGSAACRLTGRIRHILRRRELAPDPAPTAIRRILIVRPGGIGDMLMLLPAIQALRSAYPAAQIDFVCERRNASTLRLARIKGTVYEYDARPLHLLTSLGRQPYDVAIDTEQFHNFSAILTLMSGAPVRIGFRINPARLHLYTHLVSYDVDGYELAQFWRLLRPLGIHSPPATLFNCLGPMARELAPLEPAAIQTLAAKGPFVTLSPGSRNRYKSWTQDRFQQLAFKLMASGIGVAIVGSGNETDRKLFSAGGKHPLLADLRESLTLEQTASVIARSTLFAGCDSGLAHLAVAFGRPNLVLFGPSDHRKWGHPDAGQTIIARNLPCSPCAIFGYQKLCRDIPCMRGIELDQVETAIHALIDRAGTGAKDQCG